MGNSELRVWAAGSKEQVPALCRVRILFVYSMIGDFLCLENDSLGCDCSFYCVVGDLFVCGGYKVCKNCLFGSKTELFLHQLKSGRIVLLDAMLTLFSDLPKE
jgi:hypothetical protein